MVPNRESSAGEEIAFDGRGSDPFCTVLLERVSESICVSKGKFARHTRRLVALAVAEMRLFHEKGNVFACDVRSRHPELGRGGAGRCHRTTGKRRQRVTRNYGNAGQG